MNKTASIIITLGLVVGIGIIFLGGSKNDTGSVSNQVVQNVEVRDGVQYITIEAKGGYSPRVSTAKAGIPTKLVIKTDGTYDCSSSLVIRSVGFQKILAQTGEEIIDLGTPEAGTPLQGTCSMGMYNFVVNFS
jgi:plastocyanin domain-containing protein